MPGKRHTAEQIIRKLRADRKFKLRFPWVR